LRQGKGDLSIDVITTIPNRYHSHTEHAELSEKTDRLTITRLPLPTHRSGFVDQSRVFLSFARRVLAETRGKHWDVVLATSSRLMTAALGTQVARRSKARLYLDIRDLFTDTMADVLASSALRHLGVVFRAIERRTFRAAEIINLVSPGFRDHVVAVVPDRPLRFYTNGIDDEFLNLDFARQTPRDGPLRILYAGNMGDGQGLHRIVPEAAQRLAGRARFKLIGDGGRRKQLEAALASTPGADVELLDPMPRSKLFEHYREADILFLHFNDYDAFKKVLPSKIFEYAATGKRILAGVAGYSADFLRNEVEGCEVFEPCSVDGLIECVDRLSSLPDVINRESFKSKFARTNIMDEMARDVLSIGNQTPG
jgi:glycosyltransferase involved in cell wall biosynthesis